VIEGFHGRAVRRPARAYPGDHRDSAGRCGGAKSSPTTQVLQDPLPHEQGYGPRKALKIIIILSANVFRFLLASLGPKNVALTAELAEAGSDLLLSERARDMWGAALDEGLAKRDPSLGPLEIYAVRHCSSATTPTECSTS